MSVDTPKILLSVNPFIGPRSFLSGESLRGRNREIADLRDILIAERVVLLHSPSGAGKTSLLEAGLRTEMSTQGFSVLPTIRVGFDSWSDDQTLKNRYVSSVIASLDTSAQLLKAESCQAVDPVGLVEFIGDHLRDAKLSGEPCLFFDQFEEVVTLDPADQAAKTEFFRQLGLLLRDPSIWVVISMREDYIAMLDPYLALLPRRLSIRYRLDFLSRAAASSAIRLPAADAGRAFSSGAIEYLLDDLCQVRVERQGVARLEQGPFVEPVQLQVVCQQLWERLGDTETVVDRSQVEGLVSTDGALGAFYAHRIHEVAAATGIPERQIRDWVGGSLVTAQGFRSQTSSFPGANSAEVLRRLEDAYVIRSDRRRGATWFELTHDRLVAPILADNAAWSLANLLPAQRRAAEWEAQHRAPGLLVSGETLHEMEEWANLHGTEVTDDERAFIDASRGEVERKSQEARGTRRRTTLYLVLLVLALAGLVGSSFFYFQSRVRLESARSAERAAAEASDTADQARAEAEARDMASRSESVRDPYAAVLLALEAGQRTPEPLPEARVAWSRASARLAAAPMHLSTSPIKATSATPTSIAWSHDGTKLAIGDTEGNVNVVTSDGDMLQTVSSGSKGSTTVSWSYDDSKVAAGAHDGVILLDLESSGSQRLNTGQGGSEGFAVEWSPTDDSLIVTPFNGPLEIVDGGTGQALPSVSDGCISTDGTSWSPTGDGAAVLCQYGSELVMLNSRGEITKSIPAVNSQFEHVAWSPDGQFLAAHDLNAGLIVLTADGKVVAEGLRTGSELGGIVFGLEWSGDSSKLAVFGPDLSVWMFDAATLTMSDPLPTQLDDNSSLYHLEWHPELLMFAAATRRGSVQLMNADGTPIGGVSREGSGDLVKIAWAQDGSLLVAQMGDGSMRLLAPDGRPAGPAIVVGDAPALVEWSPTGSVLTVADKDGSLSLLTTDSRPADGVVSTNFRAAELAWSPAGEVLAAATEGGGLLLLDGGRQVPNALWIDPLELARLCPSAIGCENDDGIYINDLRWNRDGSLLAISGFGAALAEGPVILDQAGQIVNSMSLDRTPITSDLSWSPSGDRLAGVDGSGEVFVFGVVGAPRRLGTVDTEQGEDSYLPVDVEWSASGESIAVAGPNGLKLFDPGSTSGPTTVDVASGVVQMAWSPNDVLAVVASDNSVHLFDSRGHLTATLSGSWESAPIASWSSDGVLAIESIPSVELFGSDGVRLGLSAPICLQFGGSVWSPAGTHLAVYCGGDLTILNPDGTTSAVYSEANAQFAVGSWSPDGATLALGDNNGMVRLLSDDGAPIADPYSAAISNITNLEWHPSGKVLASGAPGVEIALRYAWSESEACETLRDIFDPLEMDQILRVDGYHSRCGLGTVVSFPLIPSMGRPPLPI